MDAPGAMYDLMPDIPVWNKCDNRCRMCANDPSFARVPSGRYLLKNQIRRFESYLSGRKGAYAKNSGNIRALNLTGGEPTRNPDLLKLLAYFRRRLRGEFTLLTNGRRFADPVFASAVLSAAKAPFTAAISLHGPNASVHDSITGVRGSFADSLAGMKNICARKSEGQSLDARLVLHGRNIRHLKSTLSLLLREFSGFKGWRAVALHYEPEGRAARDRRLRLKLEDSAAELNAVSGIIRLFGEFRIYHLPLCLLREELRPLARVSLPFEDRVYPGQCALCDARAACPGIMRPYYDHFGPAPVRRIAG